MVMFRIDGVLQLRHVLPAKAHPRVVSVIKVDAGMDIAESRKAQDGRISFQLLSQSYDLRVSVVPASLGESVVIRILSTDGDVLPLEQLGFTQAQRTLIERMLNQPQGIVLATGPTGAGKTTTLYAALRTLNALERNVMTIEDPVEYVVPLFRQVSVNDKAGYGFVNAMRSFLRQDPDVMLVGEIRDAESASMAVRAAQTGHLVPATLHTNSAVGAVVRLRDLGVATFLVSSSLLGVIAQRLLRKLCVHCRKPDPQVAGRYLAVGCPSCMQSGYFGRIAVGEVLLLSNPMRTAIEAGAGVHELHAQAVSEGMVDLAASAMAVVNAGVCDLAEMRRVIGDL
jgi:type IV pilus assembly protein PilB